MKYKNRQHLYGLGTPEGYIQCCACPQQDHKDNAYKIGWQRLANGRKVDWYCPECLEMEKYR